MNEQVKLAKSEEQPIRKHRTVFTSTKGLFRNKRWVISKNVLESESGS